MRVLVVEDEQVLADTVAVGLRRESMAVDVVYDGGEHHQLAGLDAFDRLLLSVEDVRALALDHEPAPGFQPVVEPVELDDEAMEAYLEGNLPAEETIKKCLRKAVLTGAFYPILAGSAFKNKGVQLLLDAVVDYLPSPLEVPAIKGVKLDGVTPDELDHVHVVANLLDDLVRDPSQALRPRNRGV